MASLGERLKQQRQSLGLTIEQAEAATRIRARLLEAIENDDLERLPDPGYVKGYVWSYAKYLELDPNEMTELYKRQVGDVHRHTVNILTETAVASRREAHGLSGRTAIIGAVAIALLALVVWAAVAIIGGPDEDATVPLPVEPTSTIEPAAPAPSAAPATRTQPAAEPTAPASAPTPFVLTVRVADGQRSWLRITVDGERQYEGTLESDSRQYEVREKASIRIGAPSVVTVLKDGTPVQIPEDASTPVVELSSE